MGNVTQYSARNAAINQMVNRIRLQFAKTLSETSWMDKRTQWIAANKLNAIRLQNGYPAEILNGSRLTEYYAGLNITEPDHYFESVLAIAKFNMDLEFSSLYRPVNQTAWWSQTDMSYMTLAHVVYDIETNSMKLPAGILQGDFFSTDRPNYMNYGSLGSVIGHAIVQAIDHKGRMLDADGHIVNWWQLDTLQKFQNRTKCLVDQVSNFTYHQTGLELNGNSTLNENIAVNGGVRAAYDAYTNWVRLNRPEPRLPALPYTQQQLFWIAMAQTWCGKHRTESLRHQVLNKEHTTSEYRVLGTLRNMPQFAHDFGCPIDSPMNPADKCVLW